MKTSVKISILAGVLALGASLGAASPAHAGNVWRPCKIVDVLVRPDSMSVRCTPYFNYANTLPTMYPEWFSVQAAAFSVQYFDRVLSLLMTALAHDKEVKILYDDADKDPKNPKILTVDVFK